MRSLKVINKITACIVRCAPLASIVSVINVLIDALTPVFITAITVGIVDEVVNYSVEAGNQDKILFYGILFCGVFVLKDIINLVSGIAENIGVYDKSLFFFKRQIIEKLHKLPLVSFEMPDILDKKERAERTLSDELLPEIFQRLLRIATSIVTVIGLVFVLSQYNFWLFPLSVFSAVPYLIMRIIRGKEFYKLKFLQVKKNRFLDYLWKLFCTPKSSREIRVMGFGTYLANKWIGTRDDVVSELWNLTQKDALSLFLCDFFRILCYGCSIVLVIFLIMTNNISLGIFSVCLTAFLNLQDQTRVFLVEVGNLTEELSYASDYFDFLDIDEDSDGTQFFPGLKNQIQAQNVNFCYPINEKDTLNNLNITVKKGETVVILGENGSGKTTMFKVLFGLYPCKSGKIMYDGSNIDSFIKSDFYRHNSAITQNFVSYNLTLRDNITISDVSNRLDDEKINRIITDLDLKDTIEELGGLDQQMGRQFCGKELSIGQWQKIAISRALFKESEVIILDEPTSALDPIMESTLLTKFMEIAKDKTTFIISHRVGLCKLADKIIVMKDGSAVEIGSHSELIKLNGIYTELYQMQQKWYQ